MHPSTKVVVNRGGYHQPIAGDQKVDNFSSQSAEAESASSKKFSCPLKKISSSVRSDWAKCRRSGKS